MCRDSYLIWQVIPPEKWVSDLVSNRSQLVVFMGLIVPDNLATNERRRMSSCLAPSCQIMNLFGDGKGIDKKETRPMHAQHEK